METIVEIWDKYKAPADEPVLLKTKLNELDGLEPEEIKPSPYYINNPHNPYIDITEEDVIIYVAEEVSDFSDIN